MTASPRRLLGKLDRAGPPAYAQIEERLVEAVTSGALAPGDRLPPERELSRQLGVSRMTLRQALDSLERQGLVHRAVGRRGGTFVSEPKIERNLGEVAGLTQQLRRQGHRAGARVLSAQTAEAGSHAADALAVAEGSAVFEVVRVRLSDDEPLALERSLFPADRFPGLLAAPLDGSLYELLEQRYDAGPARTVERLEPVIAGAFEADHLAVKQGAPLLLVERTAFDSDGVPVEWARDLFRGDRTRVVVETQASPGTSAHGRARRRARVV